MFLANKMNHFLIMCSKIYIFVRACLLILCTGPAQCSGLVSKTKLFFKLFFMIYRSCSFVQQSFFS